MDFVSKVPINKGWSGERKYCVTDNAGRKYLLREADIVKKDRKVEEFHIMQQLETMGLSMCRPVKLWWDEATVYSLHTWVEGDDLEDVLPHLSEAEQYRLGLETGRQLRIIHSVPAPPNMRSWADAYDRKIQRTEENYGKCPMKLEHEEFFRLCVQRGLPLLADRPIMLQHGDFHRGNLMLDRQGQIVVIDFQKSSWGDPWEEFDSITWDVQLSPAFARGRVDGYFEGTPPEKFWQLLSCYVCRGLFNGLAWAVPYGDEQVGFMKQHAENVWNWYSDGHNVPSWYQALGLRRGTVRLEPHDPCWSVLADKCIGQLKALLQPVAVDIQHVGSTAINGIHAKPILDIAVAVTSLEEVLQYIPVLEAHNFLYRGQDHPGQLLFVKGDFAQDTRTHHIHVVLHDSVAWKNYLNFRDYLNRMPEKAAAYDSLKCRLVQHYSQDRGAYTAGKAALVTKLLEEAQIWREEQER